MSGTEPKKKRGRPPKEGPLKKRPSIHDTRSKSKSPRGTRRTINPDGARVKRSSKNAGRPKGTTLDPVWKLTEYQMEIAQATLEATNRHGLFPASIAELARSIGADTMYVRNLLRNEKFQAYINHILVSDGIMLEMSFWRGMQLGLQAGDPKVLHLYATITGKIAKKEAPNIKITLLGPKGEEMALPMYRDQEESEDIEDAIIISEEDIIEED